jgi:hypothetical protein
MSIFLPSKIKLPANLTEVIAHNSSYNKQIASIRIAQTTHSSSSSTHYTDLLFKNMISRTQGAFYFCYCLLTPFITGPALLHIFHSYRPSVLAAPDHMSSVQIIQNYKSDTIKSCLDNNDLALQYR